MRKLISVLLCILMLSCVVTAQAAELNAFVTAHEIVENDLFLYTPVLPKDGTLTVTIKDQQLENAQLTTVRSAHRPVTVYCLVDLSTHLSEKQFQQTKDALNTISSRMGENDTMVITTVGKVITEGAVLNTHEARNTAIDLLKRDVYNVDMYQAITSAVTSLQTKTNYNANRCLLILSDGDHYKQGSVTQQDAANAVSKVSFPIYVLGVTGSQSYKDATAKAQNVMKMAELSLGGMGLIPADESITAAQAAEKIWENIQESNVIQIDLSEVTAADTSAEVRAVYEVNNERYESTVIVDLSAANAEGADTQNSDEPAKTDADLDAKTETGIVGLVKKNILLIGIGAAVLVVVIVAVVIAAKKRKATKMQSVSDITESQSTDTVLDSDVIFEEDLDNGQMQTQLVSDSSQQSAYPKTTAADSMGNTIVTVQFAVATHRDVNQTFTLAPHNAQVLGRDDRADIILNNEDNQLSGRHCNIEWDGSCLYIQDAGSTNGTYINSVRLKQNTWNPLESGMVVTMGSFDYIVTIR